MNIKNIKGYVLSQELIMNNENNLFIYNKDNDELYETNEIGKLIIEMLLKNYSMAEILENLAKEFNATEEDIIEDVSQFIDELIDLEILEIL